MTLERTTVGILVGGGPAPGINSVIGAVTIRSILGGCDVVGILDGFKWFRRKALPCGNRSPRELDSQGLPDTSCSTGQSGR